MLRFPQSEVTAIPDEVRVIKPECTNQLYEHYSRLCHEYPFYGFISRLQMDPISGQAVLHSDSDRWLLYVVKLFNGDLLLKIFLEDHSINPRQPVHSEYGGFLIKLNDEVYSFGICGTEETFNRLFNPETAISVGVGRANWVNDGRMLISSVNGFGYHYYNRPFGFHTKLYGLNEKSLAGKRILDIGSGGGAFVTTGFEYGLSVRGMDLGYKYWKPDGELVGTVPSENFIPHDWFDTPWPFSDNSFDLVVGTYSIFAYVPHSLAELEIGKYLPLLFEIKRITRTGSTVYGTTDLFGIFAKQIDNAVKICGGNTTLNFANAGGQRHRVIRMHF